MVTDLHSAAAARPRFAPICGAGAGVWTRDTRGHVRVRRGRLLRAVLTAGVMVVKTGIQARNRPQLAEAPLFIIGNRKVFFLVLAFLCIHSPCIRSEQCLE